MANSDVNMPDAPPPDGADDSEPLMEAVDEASTPENAGVYALSVLLPMPSAALFEPATQYRCGHRDESRATRGAGGRR